MTKGLVMRLFVEGQEKVRIEAVTEKSNLHFMREILGKVKITSDIRNINPKSVEDTEKAYHLLETIHNTEYPYSKVKIEIEYQ